MEPFLFQVRVSRRQHGIQNSQKRVPSVWFWTSFLSFLSLNGLVCEMATIMPPWGVVGGGGIVYTEALCVQCTCSATLMHTSLTHRARRRAWGSAPFELSWDQGHHPSCCLHTKLQLPRRKPVFQLPAGSPRARNSSREAPVKDRLWTSETDEGSLGTGGKGAGSSEPSPCCWRHLAVGKLPALEGP